jgi:hypothetical protein
MRRVRPSTWLLLEVIVVLGSVLAWQQRREARLRAALQQYRSWYPNEILIRFQGPVPSLDWPDEAPLGEVIEQIKLRTRWRRLPRGVPIEVDLAGLRQVGQSMRSPVPRPPANDDLSLGKKLQTVLAPLGLACEVKETCILITSWCAADADPTRLDLTNGTRSRRIE